MSAIYGGMWFLEVAPPLHGHLPVVVKSDASC